MKILLKTCVGVIVCLPLLGAPAQAYFAAPASADAPLEFEPVTRFETTQRGGMSLSQAVDSVRRDRNVERVISAETRISGGREVHYIKVLTIDGKVQTRKFPGQEID